MNIKKTTKKELLSIIEEQNYRISDYRMITGDLQESNCVVLDWSQVFAYMCVEFEMGMLDEKCKQMCPFCRSV